MKRPALAILLLITASTLRAQEVATLELPDSAEALSAVCHEGVVSIVYAREGRVYYCSKAADADFSAPQPVLPDGPEPTIAGRERRPQIAVDNQGRLFVAWQSRDQLVVARSEDGGGSWQAIGARDRGAEGGIDMPALACGPDGTVALAWVDSRSEGRSDDPLAQDIFIAITDKKGRFGKNRVATTGMPGVCPCCMPGLAIDGDGVLWMAYRSTVAGLKETQLVRSKDGKRFKNVQVSRDAWAFQGCPMSGPAIAVSDGGQRLLVAWTKDEDIYLATTTDGGKEFSEPEQLGRGWFRAAAPADDDTLLLLWDEGQRTRFRRIGAEDNQGVLESRPEGCLVRCGERWYLIQSR